MKLILSVFLLFVVPCAAAPPQPFGRVVTRRIGRDPQSSLTLDPSVIAKGFAIDGVGGFNGINPKTGKPNPPFDGPPSLTSTNNFINFCVGKTLTRWMKTGVFANSRTNFLAAPQQLAGDQIQGFAKIRTAADPGNFEFAAGIKAPAENGQLQKVVQGGLVAGSYRLCSILSAANNQPVIVPIAQRGSLDDCVYFTVKDREGKEQPGSTRRPGQENLWENGRIKGRIN
ncbi:hypothetical protein DL96DRAFT_1678191 [Flagelloscypha sp. PMI_526]|nr:hypothetical protein DL96DRAFT_1678191 [Flagelloscypha sp. PMI_526]